MRKAASLEKEREIIKARMHKNHLEKIISLLTRLNDSLQTCDINVSLYVMRRRKYDYIHSLVEYFQVTIKIVYLAIAFRIFHTKL